MKMVNENEDKLIMVLLEGKTEHTRKTYSNELQKFMAWLNGAPFASVTKEQAKAYFNLINEKSKKASTIKIIRILRRFYKIGVEKGVFETNPFIYTKLPEQDIGLVQDARILDRDELEKLLSTVKNNKRDYAMILLFITSRFTTLEITNLTWENLIQDEYGNRGAKVLTKGSTLDKPKYRIVPIRNDVMDALYAYKAECEIAFNRRIKPTDKVFLNLNGNPISETGIRKNFYALCKKAGIKKNISPKDLSHLCVALGKLYGATDQQLTNQAGFSNLNLVKKYNYVSLNVLKDPACNMIELPKH